MDSNQTLDGICDLCSLKLGEIRKLFKVPVLDPSYSEHPMNVASIIGKYFHLSCWTDSEQFHNVFMCLQKTLADEFGKENEIFSNHQVGFWLRSNSEPSFQSGVLLLPRSSFMFNNTMGVDVEGAVLRGTRIELESFIEFVTNSGLNLGGSESKKDIFFKCLETDSEFIWIEVKSKLGMNGIVILSKKDLQELKCVCVEAG